MDVLSDLLRVVRLDGAYFYTVEAAEPWSALTSPARELSPRIMPGSEHLISYHILTEGRCYGGVLGEEPVAMSPGDVLVFPQGDAHLMSSSGVQIQREVINAAPGRYPFTTFLGAEGRRSTRFVCGFLGLDRRPFNPLLAALPRRIHSKGLATAWLGDFIQRAMEESRLGRTGAEGVLTRLAELMFIEVIRRHLAEIPAEQTGWLAGLRDEVVGKALGLLHDRPRHPWTLEELAHESASSRTNLARRFTELVGQPPMQYLAQWRMQVAANLLARTGTKVSSIGEQVGYESEAAFSRAFKKATGLSPGAWRDGQRSA